MTLEFFITTIAIVVGPIFAVLAARHLERKSQTRDKQMKVFRDLMATRQVRYSMDHVSALDLVEIEFYDDSEVMLSFKNLMKHLSDSERWDRAQTDQELFSNIIQDVDECRAKMLNTMARYLGYKMSDIEIMRGGYYPKMLGDLDLQRLKANEFIVDLADGKKALPMAVYDYRTIDQFKEAEEAVKKKMQENA